DGRVVLLTTVADCVPELRTVVEDERLVGSRRRRERVKLRVRQRLRELPVGEAERCGRVRAPPAEPGSDGHVLLDLDAPAVRSAEAVERTPDDRVGVEAVHGG